MRLTKTVLRELKDLLSAFAITENEDKPKWSWNKNGCFSVKSMYTHMFNNEADSPNKKIWRAKIPLKIKIFMWLIHQNAILTKENLLKRKWQGDPKCRFCSDPESINHLFFECPMAKFSWSLIAMVVGADCRPTSFAQFWLWAQKYMANGSIFHMVGLAAVVWAIWRARNNICFEKKFIRSPTEIICSALSFILFWAELQGADNRAILEAGAEVLRSRALLFHPSEAPAADTGMVLLH
jgi:hypothetical protein